MLEKIYRSNVCSVWPFKRQDEIIARKLNAGGSIYTDELTQDERRRHKKMLPEREQLLRPTQRQEPFIINCASLGVLAINAEDFAYVLSAAKDKRLHIRDLSVDIVIKGMKDWTKAFELFAVAKVRESERVRGIAGGLKSAAVRGAKVDAAAAACKEEWPLYNYSSKELAAKYGVSIGGLKTRLGSRKEIRAIQRAAIKTKAKKEMNKCAKLK